MPDGIDPALSQESVEGLRRADLASGELEASLRAVADATSRTFEADGGGIMLLDDQQTLHYVGATNGRSAALEAAQEETGEGPCVDSLVHDTVTSTNDLVTDERWPVLQSQVAELGVHGLIGVPLHLGLSAVGSLNVYRAAPHEWTERDVAAIRAHAEVIEELLVVAMRAQRDHTIVQQLRTALENRVTIERAVGFVIAARGLDAVKAFNELRLLARSRRVRVAALAEEIITTKTFPPGEGGAS